MQLAIAMNALIVPTLETLIPTAWRDEHDRELLMLMVIGQFETEFTTKDRPDGRALGYWHLEAAGFNGITTHHSTRVIVDNVRRALGMPGDPRRAWEATTHCDLWACALARCLLRTVRDPLPSLERADLGWLQYKQSWRPGKLRPARWNDVWTWALATLHPGKQIEIVPTTQVVPGEIG